MEKNILIIDDEKNIRMTLEKALAEDNYSIDMAINGEEALKKIKDKHYSVILLDLKLPGMDGIEVLEKINELDYETNIIIITGYGSIESAVKTMKLGAIDYLRKPFKPEKIRELVNEVYEKYDIKIDENAENTEDFNKIINLAKNKINNKDFNEAEKLLQKATGKKSTKPEPFNLLGVIYELQNKQTEAMKMYRAALALDPSYKPADENLERAGRLNPNKDDLNLGENKPENKKE
ncbi:MAG: response regulator [Candidatus Mcinerneyibacterium aminivorans]|uniref:Response regulator n=1 Tax=Candidatus Mcinerneyibacterium aminivorans TaxID=2703815 RepID=A0A5D0MIJ8_9BACT|nr:MAG: response regulator [Candidatus Mcinerneyibacterium aminivorans]